MSSVLEPPARPDWLIRFNEMGSMLLSSGGVVVPLHEASLLEEARRNTGLDDFGDGDFREGLQILVRSLEDEGRLTLMGRILARSDVVSALETRLRLTHAFEQDPSLAEQEIEAPLFIVGISRSGTSILHELLAQDPLLRAPLTWEARFPWPAPEPATYASDPRIAMADRVFVYWNELVPAYRAMHEMGGAIPCECVNLTTPSFRCEEYLGRNQVKGYAQWLSTADMRPAFRFHRQMLQLLQSKMPRRRWVLKAPSHLVALDSLLAEYPDAEIVQTHRDPLQSMASTASILSAINWMRQATVDLEQIKAAFAGEGLLFRLDAMTRVRDSGAADEGRFFDVRFPDLMSDPFETIQGIYRHFGRECRPDALQRMRDYLAAKPRGVHGTHDYSFEDLGLNLATERARFADYQARYDVPSELS